MDHSSYPTPKKIMIRPKQEVEGRNLEAVGIASRSEGETDPVYRTQDKIAVERMTESEDQRQTRSPPAINAIQVNDDGKCRQAADQEKSRSGQSEEDSNAVKGEKVSADENKTEEHETSIHYHESGELYAEDVDQHMAVLPEITSPTAEITIDEIQVGEPGIPLTEDQESMRQLIWKNRHLLIGKGNALPPAARGAVCDIDVGDANPIAQRVRPVAPKFREKLADLIKGLLSAKIIRPSISPWLRRSL